MEHKTKSFALIPRGFAISDYDNVDTWLCNIVGIPLNKLDNTPRGRIVNNKCFVNFGDNCSCSTKDTLLRCIKYYFPKATDYYDLQNCLWKKLNLEII